MACQQEVTRDSILQLFLSPPFLNYATSIFSGLLRMPAFPYSTTPSHSYFLPSFLLSPPTGWAPSYFSKFLPAFFHTPSPSMLPAFFLTPSFSKLSVFFLNSFLLKYASLHPTPIFFYLRFYSIPFHYDCFYFQPKYQ